MGLLDMLSSIKRIPAECVVKLDDAEIDDMYPALVEVDVDTDRTKWTTATLVFETRRIEDGTWSVQDDERFKPWVTIKIEAVFGTETEEVMSGYIREVKAEYPQDKGSGKVKITCQDDSILLDRQHVEQRWGEDVTISDGQIAAEIALRHNVQLMDTPSDGQSVQDLNQNTTDARFLQKRAEANKFEVIFREGQMYFGEMRLDAETQSTIKVYAGPDTNCINFNIEDDGHMPDKVAYQVSADVGPDSPATEVSPNLPLLGNEAVGSESSGLDDFVWRPSRQGINNDEQMATIAQQMANEQSMKIKVTGELDASMYGHVLRTGEPVGVDGVGERYGGVYYVDSVQHKFDSSGFKSSFRLIRNAYGDNLSEDDNPLAGIL